MTVAKLKELLENMPDHARIYTYGGQNNVFSNDEEILSVVSSPDCRGMVILQERKYIDMSSEIPSRLETYRKENWTEEDALADMLDLGFDLSDFLSDNLFDDNGLYKHFKEVGESHGLC